MELQTASYGPKTDISEEELVKAFQEYSADDEFIILGGDIGYVQVLMDPDPTANEGCGRLEYRDEDDHQFLCAEEVSIDDVQSAFLKFLKGDASWKADYRREILDENFQQAETKPWWKFW